MVCREKVWLGLGPSTAMARLARTDRIHCIIDRRCTARKERHTTFRLLQLDARRSVVGDLLLEGRSSAMAVGKRHMTVEPDKSRHVG